MCLAICLLFSSCSRRNHYEDVLESKQESESDALLPQPGANGVANIIASNHEDYALEVIRKTSDIGYFEGNTEAQLQEKYQGNAAFHMLEALYLPTGRVISRENPHFFNKLTGNISDWCSDPLCEHGHDCIWSAGWTLPVMMYASPSHVYFISTYNDHIPRLYRADHQRNNIEMIFEQDCVGDIRNIWYEKGNTLYIELAVYAEPGGTAKNQLMALDMTTGELTNVSNVKRAMSIAAVIREKVYFFYEAKPGVIYVTDLNFTETQKLWDGVSIESFNDRYILLRKNGTSISAYHIDSGNTYDLCEVWGNAVLSGDYVYYMQEMTENEIAGDSHKDYYTWTWDNEPVFIPNQDGSGDGVFVGGETNVSAKTATAGRIFRMKLDGSEPECVMQLTYQGIPVRIVNGSISADGECIWFEFNHYDEFKNYYNQDYGDGKPVSTWDAEEPHLAMVDLQSGILRIIEIQE